jgi:hypothetical protein
VNDTLLIIATLAVFVGGLVVVAYLLDKRGIAHRPIDPPLPELGPLGKILLWIARILVVLMVLSLIGAIAFKSLPLALLTGSSLWLYILSGILYRVVRLTGK